MKLRVALTAQILFLFVNRCGDERLENLNKVMTLYSRGTFGKDSFQWTKCVVKYLYDVYSDLSNQMVAFLVEVRSCLNFHIN